MVPLASEEEMNKIAAELFAIVEFEDFIHTHDMSRLTEDEQNHLLDLYERQSSQVTQNKPINDEVQSF